MTNIVYHDFDGSRKTDTLQAAVINNLTYMTERMHAPNNGLKRPRGYNRMAGMALDIAKNNSTMLAELITILYELQVIDIKAVRRLTPGSSIIAKREKRK